MRSFTFTVSIFPFQSTYHNVWYVISVFSYPCITSCFCVSDIGLGYHCVRAGVMMDTQVKPEGDVNQAESSIMAFGRPDAVRSWPKEATSLLAFISRSYDRFHWDGSGFHEVDVLSCCYKLPLYICSLFTLRKPRSPLILGGE